MKHWNKIFAMILVAAFALALFAGCQAAPAVEPTEAPQQEADPAPEGEGEVEADPEVEVDPASFTGKIMSWTNDDTWHEVMEPAFQAIYPNVEFETTHVAWFDYLQKFTTSLASGLEMPDIVAGVIEWRARMYALDQCEYLEEEPYNLDRNDMLQYLIPRVSYNDKIVGIEMSTCPTVFAYNRSVADLVGLNDDEALAAALAGDNYEGFFTVGEQLKAQGKWLFSGMGDLWITITQQHFNERLDAEGNLDFYNGIEPYLKLSYDLFQAGYIGPYDQWTVQWEASRALDEVLLYPFTTWSPNSHKETYDPEGAGNWGFVKPPQGVWSWGGTTYSIYKGSEIKDTVWEFLRWTLFSTEGAIASKATGYQNSYAPGYVEAADEVASSGIDEYFGYDLFELWTSCNDSAVSVTQTIYDVDIIDSTNIAFTALNANPSMTYEEVLDMTITELQNRTGVTIEK